MIEKINKLAERVDWNDPDSIIKFYETNNILFSNYKSLENENEIVDILKIKCHYVGSLINKSRFSKAESFISEIDILNQKIKHNHDLYRVYEEKKEFYLGLIYGHLKNYSESASIFRRLIKIDPENDNYKDWYIEMRIKSTNQLTTILGITGIVIIVMDILLNVIFNVKLSTYVYLIGIFLIIVAAVFPYIYKQVIRYKIVWK